MANDYRIDITSNNQTNVLNQPVFLSEGMPERTIRAPGNVKDGSNQRFVTIKYGLPTANEIFGFTIEARDAFGFDLMGEWDRNRQHKRYPRFAENDATSHKHSVEEADAWMINVSRKPYPFFLFGEAYSMDPDYSTSSYVAMQRGDTGPIDYDSQTQAIFEMVDDNDDQDREVDWQRIGSGASDSPEHLGIVDLRGPDRVETMLGRVAADGRRGESLPPSGGSVRLRHDQQHLVLGDHALERGQTE